MGVIVSRRPPAGSWHEVLCPVEACGFERGCTQDPRALRRELRARLEILNRVLLFDLTEQLPNSYSRTAACPAGSVLGVPRGTGG